MKKLMIAAAIVCAAAFAQAASCQWNLGKDAAYKYNEAFMINASDATAVQAILDAGGANLMTDLAAYRLGDIGTATKGGSISSVTVKGIPDDGTGLSYQWVLLKTTDSDRTITDGTTGYAISKAETYANLEAAGAIVTGSATATAWDIAGDLASPAATGTIGNVPEPTSAMLLLLGVAGLALRRRRA